MTTTHGPEIRVGRLGAAAIAAGALGVSSGAANATVIVTPVGGGTPDIFFPAPGGVDEFTFPAVGQVSGISSGLILTEAASTRALKLSSGMTVGPAVNTPNSSTASLGFSTGNPKRAYFIGLSVADPTDTAATNFGYAEILETRTKTDLLGYAWETTPDTAITIRAIPEPGALALLASGALGVLAIRRRNRPGRA